MATRIRLPQAIGCNWWVIEIREMEGLLKTKKIVDDYLASCRFHETYDGLFSRYDAHISA
jgi:hypothetical protein